MGRYASVLGIFIIGVVIVISGIYFFLSSGGAGFEYQIGIVLMLVGLLMVGVGAIRGKRTMRSVGYFANYPPESYMRPPQRTAAPAVARPPAPQPAEAEPQPAAYEEPRAPAARPTPAAPATGAKAEARPKETQSVVKVLVCPNCGSENQVTDVFCFSCGKKLRPKARAAKESSRKR